MCAFFYLGNISGPMTVSKPMLSVRSKAMLEVTFGQDHDSPLGVTYHLQLHESHGTVCPEGDSFLCRHVTPAAMLH